MNHPRSGSRWKKDGQDGKSCEKEKKMSQKIENILNLALEATPEERERSGELETGYDPETREWELMTWVGYVIRKALDMRMPVAVNISFGNTYGSHEPYN